MIKKKEEKKTTKKEGKGKKKKGNPPASPSHPNHLFVQPGLPSPFRPSISGPSPSPRRSITGADGADPQRGSRGAALSQWGGSILAPPPAFSSLVFFFFLSFFPPLHPLFGLEGNIAEHGLAPGRCQKAQRCPLNAAVPFCPVPQRLQPAGSKGGKLCFS